MDCGCCIFWIIKWWFILVWSGSTRGENEEDCWLGFCFEVDSENHVATKIQRSKFKGFLEYPGIGINKYCSGAVVCIVVKPVLASQKMGSNVKELNPMEENTEHRAMKS